MTPKKLERRPLSTTDSFGPPFRFYMGRIVSLIKKKLGKLPILGENENHPTYYIIKHIHMIFFLIYIYQNIARFYFYYIIRDLGKKVSCAHLSMVSSSFTILKHLKINLCCAIIDVLDLT